MLYEGKKASIRRGMVGYLEDGTMVVIEGGRDHLQQVVRISVTSILQTSAGRMVFGRFVGTTE